MKYLEARDVHTANVSGTVVQYTIRYTRKARRVSLRISPDQGAVFVVPSGWRLLDLDYEHLLNSKARWVLQKLSEVENVRRREAPSFDFKDGSTFTYLGNQITLRVEPRLSGRYARAQLRDNQLRLSPPDGSESSVKLLFNSWCWDRAKEVIPRRVSELNRDGHFKYLRVGIRNQRSRWGSCSRRGTLSFNWRLVLAPPFVMDYIIFHELAHLVEMNHSVKFWRIVERHFPDFHQAEKWLKQHGKSLFW